MKSHRIKRHPEAAELARELYAEQDSLSGLVKETEYTIGNIARQGYAGLLELPPDRHHPLGIPALGYSLHPDSRFFKARRIIHRSPAWPTPLPGNEEYVAEQVRASKQQRVHYFPRANLRLGLPATSKSVEVEVSTPRSRSDNLTLSTKFSVDDNERAAINSSHRITSPGKEIGDPADRYYQGARFRNHYYKSVEELRDDYASSYSGALAVAGLVAASLSAAHEVETDASSVPLLLEAWRNVQESDSSTVGPSLMKFLPPHLSQHMLQG